MKNYILDVDFTISKRVQVMAESEEQARETFERLMKANPYDFSPAPSCEYVGHEIVDVNEDFDYGGMATDAENAIQYVRENKKWTNAEEQVALERINAMRCDLRTASPKIYNNICDLMDEYWTENELDGYWEDCFEYGADKVFFELQ